MIKESFKYTILSLYKTYAKTVEKPVIYKQYSEFYSVLGETMFDLLVKGQVINLPCGFGPLRIYKKSPKIVEKADGKLVLFNYRPNWAETKKLWKEKYPLRTAEELKEIKNKPLIFHKNEETDGYRYYLDVNRVHSKIPGRNTMIFNFVRLKNREFNKLIKNGRTKKVEYLEK